MMVSFENEECYILTKYIFVKMYLNINMYHPRCNDLQRQRIVERADVYGQSTPFGCPLSSVLLSY
ncbi:hypothetical protein FH063_005537 [Azospirillum argentinense]|uniref:Uncharacterized protein n=1 Tax=Azospirillum argentinense TaxID=2970906 RepID=A0A5B0KUX5_9PROT|nr:hypothetical protein FH063_005537 [Azospirillum argentinense]